MSKMDGGALVGKALANEGIEKAFVLCGAHIMPIFHGMRNAGIEIIDTRTETAAVYAAIAYTRASGKAAVVVTTAGPGVGNTPAGMMEAESVGIPLLHIGGAVAMDKRDAGDLQDMDTLELMRACSKLAKRVTDVRRIPEYISMAFRHAHDSLPGPVYLEMPTNVLWQKAEAEQVVFPANYRTEAISCGDPALIEKAAELLAKAERPAALIDDGARFNIGEHAGDIAALSDHLKMPLGDAGVNCRGLVGDETKSPLLAKNAIVEADVILALGCKFDFRHFFKAFIKPDAKIIQVHADSRQIGYNLRADIGIIGGAGPVSRQLLDAVKTKRPKPAETCWAGETGNKWPDDLPDVYQSESTPMHPARCAGEVAKFLAEEGRDWNVICDGGEAQVWIRIATRAFRPGQLHTTGPNGTIGIGPCSAIGAWAANQKPVLLYTGDGSFGFHAMEMDTMERLGIPFVCVISNDSAWGQIRLVERLLHADEVKQKGQCNTELSHMRAYERLVSMWEGYGEMVTDPEKIVPAIRRAAANGKPSIINVEVDQVNMSPFISGYAAMTKKDE
jgi:acetolactate synthase-1/2/3 large subunit